MTPDEHAAKARELLAAAGTLHQRLFDRVMSGAITDDRSVLAVAGLAAALAQVHATLATIQPASASGLAEVAEYRGFGAARDEFAEALSFPGEEDPVPQGGYGDDGSGRAALDAQDDDPSTGWDSLGPP